MIDEAVSKLATYALRTGLIQENEYTWAINTILDVLKLDSYTDPGQEWGELELAPILDLADGIVDIVETGATLRENGLEPIEDVAQVSARLIVNTASMKLYKNEIADFLTRMERRLGGEA